MSSIVIGIMDPDELDFERMMRTCFAVLIASFIYAKTSFSSISLIELNRICLKPFVLSCALTNFFSLSFKNDPWKNHGQYVKAVTHAAKSFVKQGLITQKERGAIVSAAARSSCGFK